MKTTILVISLFLAVAQMNAEEFTPQYAPEQLQNQIISQGQSALEEMSRSFRNKQQWKIEGESHLTQTLETTEMSNNPVAINCDKSKTSQPAS